MEGQEKDDRLDTPDNVVQKACFPDELDDVTFLVGNLERNGVKPKSFRVDRGVLPTTSEVFHKLLLKNRKKTIVLPDLHPNGFGAMLQYISEGKVHFNSIFGALHTLEVAGKYQMGQLRQICSDYISENFSPYDACLVYETARSLNEVGLKRAARNTLIFQTEDVIKDKAFLYTDWTTVQTILCQDRLQVDSEAQLFDALLCWGKANTRVRGNIVSKEDKRKVRSFVESLLPFIRFLSMSAVEFAEGPGQSGVLTDDEVLSLQMNILCPGSRPLPSWVSHRPARKLLKDYFHHQTFCCLRDHKLSTEVRSLLYNITVEGMDILFCSISFFVNGSLSDVTVYFEFINLTRGYIVYNCGICMTEIDGKCTFILNNPKLLCNGETGKIKIHFSTAVPVGLCKTSRDSPAVDIYGVTFQIPSKNFRIHEIGFYELTPE